MMTELAQEKHVPWFQQAYNKYVEGQRFADQVPGTRTYSGLTLGSRHQPSKLSELQRKDVHDENRFLTKKMRDAGKTLADLHYYVPHDEEDYYMQTGKLPKALTANAANADLNGVHVPVRQDDGTYLDAEGDLMTRADMADYLQDLELLLLKGHLLLLFLLLIILLLLMHNL